MSEIGQLQGLVVFVTPVLHQRVRTDYLQPVMQSFYLKQNVYVNYKVGAYMVKNQVNFIINFKKLSLIL